MAHVQGKPTESKDPSRSRYRSPLNNPDDRPVQAKKKPTTKAKKPTTKGKETTAKGKGSATKAKKVTKAKKPTSKEKKPTKAEKPAAKKKAAPVSMSYLHCFPLFFVPSIFRLQRSHVAPLLP